MPNDPSIQATAEAIPANDRVGKGPTVVSAAGAQVVFEVIVATMWSVGELVAGEVERSRAAVASMGMHPRREGSAFGAIAAGPLAFNDLEFEQLGPAEGRLAYAAAHWIAATSLSSDRRNRFLRALEQRLRLSDEDAARLSALARSVDADSHSPREAFARLMSRA
jgi:hypothetical protein